MSRKTLGDLVASGNPPTYTISLDWVVNTANTLRHRGVVLGDDPDWESQHGVIERKEALLAHIWNVVSKLDHGEVVPT